MTSGVRRNSGLAPRPAAGSTAGSPPHLCNQAGLASALRRSLDGANEVAGSGGGLGRGHQRGQRHLLPAAMEGNRTSIRAGRLVL